MNLLKPRNRNAIISTIIRIMVILPVIYVILYPLFTMISTSLQDQFQILDPSVMWMPKSVSLVNYSQAIVVLDYGKALIKTITVNVVSALLEVVTCAITAYGFARFKFKFKSLAMGILILTIILPQEMIAVPTYLQLRYADIFGILGLIGKLVGQELRPNLINTPFSFWLPSIFSVGLRSGLFIFIYMQFFRNLPKELEEAAYIDGAGPVRTYLKIIIPSSSVVILTVSIFSIIWHWNDYYLSSLYFSSDFPLAVQLSNIDTNLSISGMLNSVTSRNGIVMAGALLFIAPVLIMYLILQNKFVKSIDSVGIVG